ncbi:MAG: methyltransferase, TIGR04325 family [Rhodocyclales bacterium]|nr:methyltransferase, TIGR04325 family [Rhodocyclales bacterium]
MIASKISVAILIVASTTPTGSYMSKITFDGQYQTFGEVTSANPLPPDYHSENLVDSITVLAKTRLACREQGMLPKPNWGNGRENIVSAVLSMLNKPLSVLDIGGGVGTMYFSLKASCDIELDYTVMELPTTCEMGRKLLPEVKFVSGVPAEHFDAVTFCSALQYFEDYKSIIAEALQGLPDTVILTDTPTGPADTFSCAQLNIAGRAIPIWVFNQTEIIELFEAQGYRLRMKALSHFPFHNFDNYEGNASKTYFTNFVFVENDPGSWLLVR